MKEWQFDVIFVVSIVGAIVMLFSDPLRIDVNPAVVTLFGVMLAFVYQQKKSDKNKEDDEDDDGEEKDNKGGRHK